MFNPIHIDAVVRQRQAELEELIRQDELLREAKEARKAHSPARTGRLNGRRLFNQMKVILANLAVPFK